MRSFLAPAIIALQRPDLHQFEEIKGSPGYEGHNFLKAGRASPGRAGRPNPRRRDLLEGVSAQLYALGYWKSRC